ncbi:MAG: hypothetical protein EHM65_00385 [Acidobacteriales bacterium]|nr:MAG: hypothetical protein EHM65_00385 [Terriglobales bacterium]
MEGAVNKVKPVKLALVLQLLLVFASGILVGGFGYRFYSFREPPPPPRRESPPPDRRAFRQRYLDEMRSRLNLREEQVQKLKEIMDASGRKFNVERRRSNEEMKALHEQQIAQIRAMLDPPQISEYEKMLAEREKLMRERDKNRRNNQRKDDRDRPRP